MIETELAAGELRVRVTTSRRPLIYLDQCALYEFSKANELGTRFREAFAARGELLVTSINVFEMGQLQGNSLARMKAFLQEVIGAAWIPIEFDPMVVIEKELAELTDPSPAISQSLLELACESGSATLAGLLDSARHSPSDRALFDSAKVDLGRQIETMRREWRKEANSLEQRFPLIPRTPKTKTLSVVAAVFRMVAERAQGPQHFRWTPNDAEDFTHSITGLAHAEAVVLDGKWAERVRDLTPAQVFSCGELPRFMDWFEGKP
jgi:hypothetical protein